MDTKIIKPADAAYEYPLLIKRLLMSAQRHHNGHEIVYRDLFRYDYPTLIERVSRLANVLTAAGVRAGDTVAVLDWDSHRYLECFFAVPMIGAVLHHVNIRLSDEQVLYTMNHAEDQLVLAHRDFVPLLENLQGSLESVRGCILLTDDNRPETELPLIGEYEELLEGADCHYHFPDFDENSVATTFYTTGTTGNPKGVYFTHRQLVLHTLNAVGNLAAYEGAPLLRSHDVYMPITPMFHVHAWGVPYVATMLGVKQVYPGRYEADSLVRLQQTEGVTFSHCVPTLLQMMLGCDESLSADFQDWKILTGGSALPQGLAERAQAKGIHLYTGYGMSETCPLLAITSLNDDMLALAPAQQLEFRRQTGLPVNMVDIRILDGDGTPLPHDGDHVGEVVVRAPWLTRGYIKEPDKQEALWEDGWLHTGDIACIHPTGFIEIKDRIKDVIKTGGEWISSLELETLISEHPDVQEVAVVGLPDADWGERPCALIVPANSETTDDDIRAFLTGFVQEGKINKWAIPSHIDFVQAIPKTSVGKIDKKRIRQLALEGI
ncbi:MAG: fatty acid--CoA ligase [Oceanospirillaceae bacterium]|nr:fatty acid--CoA ligase [Oceanospirillaceae bacterium]